MGDLNGWVKCSERMPEHNGPPTFLGGQSSALVIGLWAYGKFPEVRQCIHIEYDPSEDCDPADGWMVIDETGACDRCTSHGGHAPSHWMPMPPIVDDGEAGKGVGG